jgi:protoporphyrinogen oxidase
VLLGARAEAILLEQGRAVGVRTADGLLPADVVVSTVTTSTLRRLLPPLDHEYFRRIDRIPTIGIVCALLRLKHPVTPVFWVNANDRRVPFAGMIEYTHLNPLPDLGGDRILYIPQYLAVSDARFAQDDETVISGYADALALIQPAFERSWIRQAFVFRERFAQPVCLTDYRSTTPAIATPITNLFLTDSCQLHPHDRSISGALGLGRNAARLALDALRTSTRS